MVFTVNHRQEAQFTSAPQDLNVVLEIRVEGRKGHEELETAVAALEQSRELTQHGLARVGHYQVQENVGNRLLRHRGRIAVESVKWRFLGSRWKGHVPDAGDATRERRGRSALEISTHAGPSLAARPGDVRYTWASTPGGDAGRAR
jgi:hypothetical protein